MMVSKYINVWKHRLGQCECGYGPHTPESLYILNAANIEKSVDDAWERNR